ncbi:hydrogenase maturation nickel metallochaperone HypA [Desulfocapsa sp. AH-315-G09]|uniref:Hydrogenase maturation nickel metallochaperone HypA n=1 Tax=Desulfotalea psychrophila TaxID=84980 RepID=A0ABS3ASD9_9BACT|nr:hydrogenase maturation nickel metallochaperone HypA [Desulfocapsa sp.]MBN4065224.1 hydrogenase maturation nickel metallochaperone HypA [Desulfocapsa sp. AH-315-G09]MBN4068038.1 hydrogenase maturation nickel metallochaperone HypA [Desulfotalea psychrophila]
MHELSLAQGLISQLKELAGVHKATRIVTVRVNVGTMAGIVIDSFTFGFNAVKTETNCVREAQLEITEVDGDELILAQVIME